MSLKRTKDDAVLRRGGKPKNDFEVLIHYSDKNQLCIHLILWGATIMIMTVNSGVIAEVAVNLLVPF